MLRIFSMTCSCFIPHFIQNLHLILFSKRLRRNMMPEELEKKRQEILVKAKQRRRDRCLLPLRLTSCIFQKPVILAMWSKDVHARRPWKSPSKPLHSGDCRDSKSTALKENLSGPWTAQTFPDSLSSVVPVNPWVVLVPGLCTLALSPSLPSLQMGQSSTQGWGFFSHTPSADDQ